MSHYKIALKTLAPPDWFSEFSGLGLSFHSFEGNLEEGLLNHLFIFDHFQPEALKKEFPYDWFLHPEHSDYAFYFLKKNKEALRLRSFFIKPVSFVGAGVGRAELCTLEGIEKLKKSEVCLFDHLLDDKLLSHLNPDCQKIFVGKRCGAHSLTQRDISWAILNQARTGKKVVRLKGGDPTIFGRIAEEIELLEDYGLPYSITPAVSSFQCASIDSGALLTKRGESSGFTIMSARTKEAKLPDLDHIKKENLPLVFYMGTGLVSEIAQKLMANGISSETPMSIVYSAGSFESHTERGTLDSFSKTSLSKSEKPGLVMIGECCRDSFQNQTGALEGRRILVTGSDYVWGELKEKVFEWGGNPMHLPLIRFVPQNENLKTLINTLSQYKGLLFLSPTSIDLFMESFLSLELDLRILPPLLVRSENLKKKFKSFGLIAQNYEGECGTGLAVLGHQEGIERFIQSGKEAQCFAIYSSIDVPQTTLPPFDVISFSSSKTLQLYLAQFGKESLQGKDILALGDETLRLLKELKIEPSVFARSSSALLKDYVTLCLRGEMKKEFA